MLKFKSIVFLAVIVLMSIPKTSHGQDLPYIDPMYYHVFDKDSLAGFDESAARATAISEGYMGIEYKIRLHDLKREYIDSKYNLTSSRTKVYNSRYTSFEDYLMATRPAAVPGCSNEDFEASAPGNITAANQIAGWTLSGGYNGNISPTHSLSAYFPGGISGVNSCNLLGCCPMPPSKSEIIDCSAPGGYIDNVIGAQYPIFSVFGTGTVSGASAANPQIGQGLFGTKVIRLNNKQAQDYSIERLSKTFSVTPANALFQFAFIAIMEVSHPCCSAGGFQIILSNASANTVIPCPNFSVSAPNSQCTATVPVTLFNVGTGTPANPNAFGGIVYNEWKINSMDLTDYIGQNITIDIIVTDCDASGHYGSLYFDAQCGPMKVYGNGQEFDAGTNVYVPTCGASGATICAADGLGPYSWVGPNITPNQSTPSMTNQCMTTSVSAQYTLYMEPEGSCAPIARLVNSTITPAPLLNASVLQATCGNSLAVVSVTPSGSAAIPSTLNWYPTPQALNTATTSGTYSVLPLGQPPIIVTITATDPLGCLVTATAGVNAAPPVPTFSIVNVTNSHSITCDHPVIYLDAVTTYSYNNGSLNYFWASASNTFVTYSVSVNNPGTFTVEGRDPVTNCAITETVAIGINTVAPVSIVSPSFQTIDCNTPAEQVTVTAVSPTVNLSHHIISPFGGTFSAASYSVLYEPSIGTYTYNLKNEINGCITTRTFVVTSNDGFPMFKVNSLQNFTIGCNSTSCAVVSIDDVNTELGGPASYTILAPGASSTTPAGTLSALNVYTTCVAGNYTVITKDNTSMCETRVPISILSKTLSPEISAIVERQVLDCNNPKVTLKGVSTTPGVEYYWNFTGTPNTQQGDTITAKANTLLAASNQTLVNSYTLVINNLSSTCKSFSTIPIYQNFFRPRTVIAGGGSSLTCLTHSITLTNQSVSNIDPATGFPRNQPVVGFLWEGPSPQDPASNATSYLAKVPGVYTLTSKDLNNGCTSQTTAVIIDNRVYPDLTPSTLTGTLDCGTPTTITVTPVNTANLTYSWTSPPTSVVGAFTLQTLSVKDPGEYSVLVTNTLNGCFRTEGFAVVNGSITADFTADQVTGFVPITITFSNTSFTSAGSASINSVWNFGNGTSGSYSTPSTSNLYTQPGTYTVTLYASKGTCLDSKQKVIQLDLPSSLEIPNVFTPNGDGINDLFFVKANNLKEITAVIIDRWGRTVYEVTSPTGNIEWDGKNQQGKEAAEGTYFYTIKATGKDNKDFNQKGTINLYR